jgi:hypothetical protein
LLPFLGEGLREPAEVMAHLSFDHCPVLCPRQLVHDKLRA